MWSAGARAAGNSAWSCVSLAASRPPAVHAARASASGGDRVAGQPPRLGEAKARVGRQRRIILEIAKARCGCDPVVDQPLGAAAQRRLRRPPVMRAEKGGDFGEGRRAAVATQPVPLDDGIHQRVGRRVDLRRQRQRAEAAGGGLSEARRIEGTHAGRQGGCRAAGEERRESEPAGFAGAANQPTTHVLFLGAPSRDSSCHPGYRTGHGPAACVDPMPSAGQAMAPRFRGDDASV